MNEDSFFSDELTALLDSNAEMAKQLCVGFADFLDVTMQCFWSVKSLCDVEGLTVKQWTRFYRFATERFAAVTGAKADTENYPLADFLQFVENETI